MKKNSFYIILLFLMTFFSCQQEIAVPDYIIAEEEMVELLVEIELVQAEVKYSVSSDTRKDGFNKEFDEVFSKYGLTRELFNKNLEYYCKDPLIVKDLYDKVIVRLSEKQAHLNDRNSLGA